MAHTVRLLVSDVDGTLVGNDKSLSQRNADAIGRVRDAGIAVALISARPPSGIIPLVERLALDGPSGAFNGGTVFMTDGTITRARHLSERLGADIVSLIERAGIEAWVFSGGQWLLRGTDNPHVPRECLSAGIGPTMCADLAASCGEADKIVAVSDDHAAVSRLEEEARQFLGEQATVGRSQPYYLDFTPAGADKGDGIEAIASAFDVPLEEVLAIGDGPNDVAMFTRAGLSVAMGNAEAEVRNAATMTTGSNEEDGLAAAIDKLLPDIAP